ncbi:hypothetical protein E2C01_073110 [Portunus trituberculatus]|uniref:Uncharacterized protein n=1 Tax=Portunus trituberculatus TaxID=210409 RepID=A0A5B7ICH2_PORTR|nr:hypothetical protein [Portunus trituberculatus]
MLFPGEGFSYMRPRIREVRGALCRRGVEHFIGKQFLNNSWSILPGCQECF